MRRSVLSLPLVACAALLLVCAAVASPVSAGGASPSAAAPLPSEVVVLTDDNFDELTSSGSWLLEFYAPWCGHCKTLAPAYEEAARTLRGTLNLAKIDATAQSGLATRYDIKGFPTSLHRQTYGRQAEKDSADVGWQRQRLEAREQFGLTADCDCSLPVRPHSPLSLKFFREGEIRNYNGARTLDGMVSFGREMSAPAVTSLATAEQFSTLADRQAVTAVFFGATKGGVERRLFDSLAYRLQGSMRFMRVEQGAADVYAAAGVSSEETPLVLLVTKHADLADAAQRYAGPWVDASLRDFLLRNKLPLISELDQNNFDDVTGAGKRVVLAVVDAKGAGAAAGAAFVSSLYALAKQPALREQLVFASLDGVKYNKYVGQFGVSVGEGANPDTSALPTVVVLDRELDYYFAPPPQGADGRLHPIGDAAAVSAFLHGVVRDEVPLTGTSPWYHPARYIKLLEKSLSKLPVWQVAVLATAIMLSVVAALFWCCFYGLDDAVLTPEEQERLLAQEKGAVALAAQRDASPNSAASDEATTAKQGMRSRKAKADQ